MLRHLFFSFLAAMAPLPSAAQTNQALAALQVLPGWVTASGTRMVAFQITLEDGWKTYWRSPGDAGIPPHFGWEGSRNLEEVSVHWPQPQVFHDYGLRTVGYENELVLPIELTSRAAGAPIRLAGSVSIGICKDICVPVELAFDAELSGAGQKDQAISAALKSRPVPAASAGMGRAVCSVAPIDDGLRVSAQIEVPSGSPDVIAIMELADPSVWVSDAQVTRTSGGLEVTADMVPPEAAPFAMARRDVRITLVGQERAYELQGCDAAAG
ncbi:MAG: protein-disulfide reductase DsbD domain-containing protein [Pseudomonadota bacterium]